MSLILLPKQYQDGQILKKAALDAIVTSLLGYFNGKNLGGANFQSDTITQAKLTNTLVTIPVGAVVANSFGLPGSKWMYCDGSAISRTTYSALFALIGTTYGSGNGTTTFNIPDCRGRISAMKDTSLSLWGVIGSTTGDEHLGDHVHPAGTLSLDSAGTGHLHGVMDAGHIHIVTLPVNAHSVVAFPPTTFTTAAGSQNQLAVPNTAFENFGFTDTKHTGVTVDPTSGGNIHTITGVTDSGTGLPGVNGAVQPTLICEKIIKVL